MNPSTAKNAVFWAVMVGTAVLLWAAVRSSSQTEKGIKQISFTEFVGELDRDNVREVTIEPGQTSVVLKVTGFAKQGDAQFKTTIPASYADVYRRLLEKNVNIVFKDRVEGSAWLSWVGNGLLPMIILVGFWTFFMRQMQKGKGR